jgi:hypothetical protein
MFPYTLSITPSSYSLTNLLYQVVYDFGDGTTFTDNGVLNADGSLVFNTQNHTYYTVGNIIGSISFYQIGLSQPTIYPINLNLSLPSMEGSSGYFQELHLVGTRMFGPYNDILYMFESINPNYAIPTLVNWQTRPIVNTPNISQGSYRPYRLLAPFENPNLVDINIGTNLLEFEPADPPYNPDDGNASGIHQIYP